MTTSDSKTEPSTRVPPELGDRGPDVAPTRNHRRSRRLLAAVAAVAALAAAAAWLVRASYTNGSLLARSTNLLDVSALAPRHRGPYILAAHSSESALRGIIAFDASAAWLCWLAPGQATSSVQAGQLLVPRQNTRGSSEYFTMTIGPQPELWLLDRGSFAERPAPAANRLLLAWAWVDVQGVWRELDGAVSPDGKWLLGVTHDAAGRQATELDSLDGARALRYAWWPDYDRRFREWLPDSSGWIEARLAGNQLVIERYDLAHGRPIAISSAVASTNMLTTFGVTQDGRLIFSGTREVLETDAAPIAGGQAKRLGTASAPGFRLVAARVSPLGDRIAWTLRPDDAAPPRDNFAGRLLRWLRLAPEPSRAGGIWLSRLDGSDMRCLGRLDPTPKDPAPVPRMVMWTPDGRRLRYTHQNALYDIPVD